MTIVEKNSENIKMNPMIFRTESRCIMENKVDFTRIETILRQYPSIQDAKITIKETQNGERSIIAYLTSKPNQIRSNQLIRGFLLKQLPEEIIPSEFIWIDNQEIHTNLDIETKMEGLQSFKQSSEKLELDYVFPQTETEKEIARIWGEILDLERISVKSVFFEIGGDSLKCSQVFFLVNEKFPNVITLVDLFKYNTIETLSTYIDECINTKGSKDEIEVFTL